VAITPPSRSSTAGSSATRVQQRRQPVGLRRRACSAPSSALAAGAAPQRRQRASVCAARQLARAHLAQRDARGDALDVADAAQRFAQRLEAAAMQLGDRAWRALARAVALRGG
jgi:hypothetical protein